MTRYQIEDALEILEFVGERVAGPESTRPHPVSRRLRARWTVLTIYSRADGGYILHRVNESTVWHVRSGAGHVRMPALVPIRDLPDGSVYCGEMPPREGRVQCAPLGHSDMSGGILLEKPQYNAWQCPDYAAVIGRLAHAYARVNIGAEGEPVRRLLEAAARTDPGFARGGKPVVRL